MRLRVGHQYSQFWPILVRFKHYYSSFWGARVISTIDDPRNAFTCLFSTLTVPANSDPFRGLFLTVWGPTTISLVVEPQVALTCRSSTLTVLAESGPPHGLLLTILGSRGDFHDSRTAGCVYVSVMNTNNFGRFWSVSCTITRRFGVPKRFPRLVVPGVRLCVRHQH